MAAPLPRSPPSAWRGHVARQASAPPPANDNAPPVWPRVFHFVASLIAVALFVAAVVWPLERLAG